MIVIKESKHCKLILLTQEEYYMSFLPEGFKPEKIEDSAMDNEFKPLKGAYVASIEKLTRDQGTWPSGDVKDQINLQLRIKDVVEGDKGVNRVVFKKYSMVDGEYSTGAENRAKLVNALCTAGYDVDCDSEESFYASLSGAVGLTCNLRLWVNKEKQMVKFVNEIKKSAVKKTEDTTEDLPF